MDLFTTAVFLALPAFNCTPLEVVDHHRSHSEVFEYDHRLARVSSSSSSNGTGTRDGPDARGKEILMGDVSPSDASTPNREAFMNPVRTWSGM